MKSTVGVRLSSWISSQSWRTVMSSCDRCMRLEMIWRDGSLVHQSVQMMWSVELWNSSSLWLCGLRCRWWWPRGSSSGFFGPPPPASCASGSRVEISAGTQTHSSTTTYYTYTILPKVLAPLLMKGWTALVISMSVNLNV